MFYRPTLCQFFLLCQGFSHLLPAKTSVDNQAMWPLPEFGGKRISPGGCPAFEPFQCPEEGTCISIQYLCDGAPDCIDGYDEDSKLCTAARRPPVEETANFLKSLLLSHGPNFLERIFGPRARNNLQGLGGVDHVAIVLSESQTIEDLGHAFRLGWRELRKLEKLFDRVEKGKYDQLHRMGIKGGEIADMKYFFEKLINTGFLDGSSMKSLVG